MPRDGLHHAQEPLDGYFNLGPARPPKPWIIAMLQDCGLAMQARAMAERDDEASAAADALLNMASGFDDAACECVQAAGSLRRIG